MKSYETWMATMTPARLAMINSVFGDPRTFYDRLAATLASRSRKKKASPQIKKEEPMIGKRTMPTPLSISPPDPTTHNRAPTPQEQAAMDHAATASAARRAPPAVKRYGSKVRSEHNEPGRARVQRMNDAFGTQSASVDATFLTMLDSVTSSRGEPGENDVSLNSGLAIMAAVEPKNELEAALALQMTGSHFLTVEMMTRARHAGDLDHIERYTGMAVKLQRTFAAQVEALAKLRGGGKQTVEVKHTYVDARGSQNVIAETVNTGGGGSGQIHQLPHGPDVAGLALTSGLPLWGKEPAGQPVPGASDEG